MKRTLFLLPFMLMNVFSSIGQGSNILLGLRNYGRYFEFIKIDCNNDSLTILNSLPNVYYTSNFSSSFDYANQKYYLCFSQQLQVINATNGNLDTTYDFNTINPNHFIHSVFNPADGFIYGIKDNWVTFDQTFAKFDPATGVLTDLFPISPTVGIGIGCKASIDPYLGEYYIQSRSLAAININTGQTVYNLPLQNPANEWLDHLAYSCKQKRFYGLTNNYHTTENYFSEIDTTSGVTTRVNASPLPTYFYKQYLSGSTIDNSTDVYYYAAAGGIIYGVDINTGNVVYNHDFGPNLQFLFLESASTYNCLTAGVNELTDNSKVEVYPNPGTGLFTFEINTGINISFDLEITDVQGKTIAAQKITQRTTTIDLRTTSKGVYFYRVKGESFLKFGKIVNVE